jgi:hypothetical protein
MGTSLTTAAFLVPQEASAQSRRGYDMFYDDLAQDGRWVEHPRYGWVWYPTRVRDDWRPYNDGRWVWTDQYGWYWESNERFGWATYHYGRWGYDDQYGHIWVPGDEWAPAWVSFRDSDDAIGWAPLPPETLAMTLISLLAGGRSSNYYRYVDMSDAYYQPRWTFVPTRYFTDDRVYTHAYSWRDNDRYYRGSRNVTNYTTVNNYYVNRSIDPQRWESRTGRKVDRVVVREVDDRREWSNDRRGDNQLRVYNPRIERDRDGRSAPPPAVRAKADDKPVVRVQREWTAPEERRDRANTRDEWRQRYTQGNDRDRDQDRDRDGRDRDNNRQVTTPGGATPATPATPAIPGSRTGEPTQRATPATPATPPDRAGRPDRDNDRGQRERVQQQREQEQKAQQDRVRQQQLQQREQQEKAQQQRQQEQKAQQDRVQQQREQQQKAQQERAQQQREQQQKAQQERAQQQREQQQKVQQQREQQQERAQQRREQQQKAQPAERARPQQTPQQATRPEKQEKPQQQQQQQQKRGNDEEERQQQGGPRR